MAQKPIKEFAVTVKLHNNRLRERRLAEGKSCKELAEAAGIPYQAYVSYENLTYLNKKYGQYPWRRVRGGWTPSAVKLSQYFGVLPEDLFPASVLALKRSQKTLPVSVEEMRTLMSTHQKTMALPPDEIWDHQELRTVLSKAMDDAGLNPNQRKVLMARYFEDLTLQEVSDRLGWRGAERARQVEACALRKMRYGRPLRRLNAFRAEEDAEFDVAARKRYIRHRVADLELRYTNTARRQERFLEIEDYRRAGSLSADLWEIEQELLKLRKEVESL